MLDSSRFVPSSATCPLFIAVPLIRLRLCFYVSSLDVSSSSIPPAIVLFPLLFAASLLPRSSSCRVIVLRTSLSILCFEIINYRSTLLTSVYRLLSVFINDRFIFSSVCCIAPCVIVVLFLRKSVTPLSFSMYGSVSFFELFFREYLNIQLLQRNVC